MPTLPMNPDARGFSDAELDFMEKNPKLIWVSKKTLIQIREEVQSTGQSPTLVAEKTERISALEAWYNFQSQS